MNARLEILATILVLLVPAAYAATARLVIDNGAARQEITIVALNIKPGLTVTVVPDVIQKAGFEPPQRAPPEASLRVPPDPGTGRANVSAAPSGEAARTKGVREHRNDTW